MLTILIIGLCERYGLKAKAIMLIKQVNGLSTGILLIVSTLEAQGIIVDPLQLNKAAIPVAIISLVIWAIQNMLLDKRLKKKYASRNNNVGGAK